MKPCNFNGRGDKRRAFTATNNRKKDMESK